MFLLFSLTKMTNEWYSYVKGFDEMLCECLLTCGRNSLNIVHGSLRSEGDINPAPILIMHMDVEDRVVTMSPDMATVGQEMEGMRIRIQKSLEMVPRIAQKLGLPKELHGRSFADLFMDDPAANEIHDKILLEIEYNKEELNQYVMRWVPFKYIWETSEEEFIKNITDSDQSAEVFEGSIEHYTTQGDVVTMQDTITNVYFVMVNVSRMKNTVLDFIERFQMININLLTKQTASRVKSELRRLFLIAYYRFCYCIQTLFCRSIPLYQKE